MSFKQYLNEVTSNLVTKVISHMVKGSKGGSDLVVTMKDLARLGVRADTSPTERKKFPFIKHHHVGPTA